MKKCIVGVFVFFIAAVVYAQTGNVGIGTVTPLKQLHIIRGAGSGAVSTGQTSLLVEADGSHYVSMLAPSGQETGILHGRPGASIRSGIVFDLNSGIRFRSGGNVTRMLLDSVGKFGIGTATPVQKLEVNGKIKLGDDAEVPVAGTIRWNDTEKDFEGYTGTAWVSLTKAGVPPLGEGSSGPVSNYQSIFPNDINEDKEFGFSVDIDSNYAIIGAIRSDNIPLDRYGAAYIFNKLPDGTWQQQAKLLPDAADLVGRFGYRVTIYGDYAAVTDFIDGPSGINLNQTSQIYIFKRTGTTWAKQTILNEVLSTIGGNPRGTEFGYSIDMDSLHLVAGAPQHNVQAGAAFVYQRTGTTWSAPVTLSHQLINTDVSPHFGTSVSIYKNEIIVGSPDETDLNLGIPNSPYGRVYLYRKQTGVWNNIFDIMPGSYGNVPTNSIPLLTKFGQYVALYDRYMIVAAPFDNSVFFYANDGTGEIRFGYNDIKGVGMYENKAIILSASKVYVHKRVGSSWNLYAYYTDPDNGVPASAAIWSDEIVMGIPVFYRCAGINCFSTGKASFATVQ
jgi:FG-GAP repeat